MLSVNKFRANLKYYVDKSIEEHQPIEVSRKNGDSFMVLSMEDYRRDKETLYILENSYLMRQINSSLTTFNRSSGYRPSQSELNLDGD